MKYRLYIGRRRLRGSWVEIDDVMSIENDAEELLSNNGAKGLLERLGRENFVLQYANGQFVGNIWESKE